MILTRRLRLTQKFQKPPNFSQQSNQTLWMRKVLLQPQEQRSLIIVDLQNDFCETGSLPVKEASQIIPKINELKQKFKHVFLTKDWHPDDHVSFNKSHQGKKAFENITVNGKIQELWPTHCVQNTWGSEFHKDLYINQNDIVIQKGYQKHVDAYSGFGNDSFSTDLESQLLRLKIKQLFIVGLAYDFCVLNTAISGFKAGFEICVIEDCCKAIDEKTVHQKFNQYIIDALNKDSKLRRENFSIIPDAKVLFNGS